MKKIQVQRILMFKKTSILLLWIKQLKWVSTLNLTTQGRKNLQTSYVRFVVCDSLEKIDYKFMRNTSILYLKLLTSHALIKIVARYFLRRVTLKFIIEFTVGQNLSSACSVLKVLHRLATCEIMHEDTQILSLINAIFAPKVIIEGICWQITFKSIILKVLKFKTKQFFLIILPLIYEFPKISQSKINLLWGNNIHLTSHIVFHSKVRKIK